MAKKLNLQAGTKAEAFSFADIDKPWGAGSERFHIDALWPVGFAVSKSLEKRLT